MDTTNFEFVKERDEELGIGAHKWYGKEDQTDTNLMHDKGTGDTIVMRFFPYKMNPELKTPPTKEQILTPDYVKHLKVLLWADGLRTVTEPTVKIDKDSYTIGVACQAANGQVITEQSKYLQEWMQ